MNVLCLHVPNQRPFTLNSIRITDAQGQGVAHTLPQSDCMLPIIEVTPESAFTHLLRVKDEQGETEKITITAESDNPAVMPVDAISVETGDFAGQWGYRGNRKITVKHSGHAGTATVRWTLTSAAGVRREFCTNVTCK